MGIGYHSLFFDTDMTYADYALGQEFVADEIIAPISKMASNIMGLHSNNISAVQALSTELGIALANDPQSKQLSKIHSGLKASLDQSKMNYEELQFVNINLKNIHDTIAEIDITLSWYLGEIINKLDFINRSLQDIANSIRSPSQTWSLEQFHMASKAYKSGHYRDALEYMNNSIYGNQYQSGYKLDHRFHYLTGLCHMELAKTRGSSSFELKKAVEAFLTGGGYCSGDKDKSDCYLMAALCEAYQKNYKIALKHLTTSDEYDCTNPSISYLFSKIFLAKRDFNNARMSLIIAFQRDRRFITKSLVDQDFRGHIQLRDRAIENYVQHEAVDCLSIIHNSRETWLKMKARMEALTVKLKSYSKYSHIDAALEANEPEPLSAKIVDTTFTLGLHDLDKIWDQTFLSNERFKTELVKAIQIDERNSSNSVAERSGVYDFIESQLGKNVNLYGDIKAFRERFFNAAGEVNRGL